MRIITTFNRFGHEFKFIYNRKSYTMGIYIDGLLERMYIGDKAKRVLDVVIN